jgi:hypothetical protein
MKRSMSKYIKFIAVVMLFAACSKNMTDLNVNQKAPANVPGETLFSNGELSLANVLVTPNVNTGIFELIVQYWAETTYPQESQYDLGNRDIPLNWWNTLYRDVIQDFNQSIILMRQQQQDPTLLPEDQAAYVNKIAIAKIMRAYSFSILVNTFGDIPYTEALQGRVNTTPKYDNQQDIYYALLDTINQSIQEMDLSAGSFGTADLIYGGDVDKWYRFANSIKLKLGILLADVDPQRSQTEVESAAPNVFTSNDDNALLRYTTTPPNVNPIWTNLVQSNRNDFVAANTLVDTMNAHKDPRREFYFTTTDDGDYVGGVYGAGNSFSNYSHPSDKVEAADFPAIIMDYAEVQFFLAEAAARGFNVSGTAQQHYNSGVTASIEFWGGSSNDAQEYLAQAINKYDASNWQKSIGVQAWINYYTRGFDAWVYQRHLDYPQLQAPPSAVSEYPVRYTYPSTEINLNQANYEAASSSIGGDEVTTHLFWDVQ